MSRLTALLTPVPPCRAGRRSLWLALLLCAPYQLIGQHAHLNAGAVGTNQNDQLIWANAADFGPESGYVKTLFFTNDGRFAGYYQGGITPTALPATEAHAGPDPAASALGSYLQFKIACLEGPPDGTFNFWEASGSQPVLSLRPGESSDQLWPLSENDGSAGSDPYGHIHGRRFTVTKLGLYKIAFTAVDTSVNGASGGPLHTPSAPLPVWFQAGANLRAVPGSERARFYFAAWLGATWQVEGADALGPGANRMPVGAPLLGDDYFHEIVEETAPTRQRFYQVRSVRPGF